MNLNMIVGTFPHWRHLPTLARDGNAVFLFFDHRTPLSDRAIATRDALDQFDVDKVQPFVASPCPTDCAANVHDWRQIRDDGCCVGLCCQECGREVPAPIPVLSADTIRAFPIRATA